MTPGTFSSSIALFVVLCNLCTSVGYNITVVTKTAMTMGESPVWDDETQTVILVDIIEKRVYRFDPANPDDLKYVQLTGGRVTPAVPIAGTNTTKLLVGVGLTLTLVDVDWGSVGENATLKSSTALATVDSSWSGNRFNDGKADYKGRLWIGTMDDSDTARRRRSTNSSSTHRGSVYRFDLTGDTSSTASVNVTRVLTDMEIPNGMVWTPGQNDSDRTFYLADSDEYSIYSYKFLGSQGLVTDQKVVFNFTANNITGSPDGMTIDYEGNLWIACVHGSMIIRVDPRTGDVLLRIPMSVKSIACVEWGGPNRDVLYVATSKYKCSAADMKEQPDAGRMFAITGLGTRGYSELPYQVQAGHSSSWAAHAQASFTLVLSLLAVFKAASF